MSADDRLRHIHAIGQTGTGKTTFLRSLVLQDILAGRGVALLDPHGDLAEELLDFIPPWRTRDTVYLNPLETERPIGVNPLRWVPFDRRDLIASDVVSTCKHLWRDSWGPRLEYVLKHAVRTLLDFDGATLLGVPRLLLDPAFRLRVLLHCRTPAETAFWREEFARYGEREQREIVAPILNKAGAFVGADVLRRTLGQVATALDFDEVLSGWIDPATGERRRRILIANLAKGRLGEDVTNLLGSLIVASMQGAAMRRAALPEAERVPCALVLDEFHSFTTTSLAGILSESRKYRLSLVLANQYERQITEPVLDAVKGNVGTVVAFRVGAADAQAVAAQLGREFTEEELATLPNHAIRVRALVDGEPYTPFRGRTFPPDRVGTRYGRAQTVMNDSRVRHGTRRAVVDGNLKSVRQVLEERMRKFMEG